MPDEVMTICLLGFPDEEPKPSSLLTMSMPSTTSPNTTCLSSSHEVTAVVTKNYSGVNGRCEQYSELSTYLRAVGVGAGIGHGKKTGLCVLQREILICVRGLSQNTVSDHNQRTRTCELRAINRLAASAFSNVAGQLSWHTNVQEPTYHYRV